ncbi:hyaluronan-mediated motility receptor-like [Dendronephthya gigantea]|uniref:hyaluronan-mediated motility receptor-like n=1 Tax=Dendronephthya gigantea TaxID=151771 RepID=UPI00106977FB|nr:hyaluronan-mediated motility receptor-like [Dendronephthya gigantea]
MFSRSKRFNNQVEKTPAPGQYDISKGPSSHGNAVLFPKDKRFKEPGTTCSGDLLDISSCSTASIKSSGSLNTGVFLTPRKPCGMSSKGEKTHQTLSSDELSRLSRKISELEHEIEKLHAENKLLQKLNDSDLSIDERQAMESSVAALKEEVEELRKQIEGEMERNKELVYQQNSYECSLKTMQADLELANSKVAALQQQIDSLEQMNADITESREELEDRCTRLRGINLALQEEKIDFQERLEDTETKWKGACATKEELLEKSLLCKERHQLEIQTLERSLKEKLENVEKLTEERKSLDETVKSYKNKIEHLKSEMDGSIRNQKETIGKMKIEKGVLVDSLEKLKNEYEQTQEEILRLQEIIKRKEEAGIENLTRCQNLEDQIAELQRSQTVELESLAKELKLTKNTLRTREDEFETVSVGLQETRTQYESVLQTRQKLEEDLNVLIQEKRNLDSEFLEATRIIRLLRENEQEQKSISESLITKLDVCSLTITHQAKMNTEYQETIKANGRKVHDVLENLQNMTKKCESLENQFALSQQSRNVEIVQLAKELETSETLLKNREKQYETVNKALEETKGVYEDEHRHRLQLEHNLQVMTKNKSTLDLQLTEKQRNVDELRKAEKEHRSTVEILKKKMKELKEENEASQTILIQQNRNEIERIKEELLSAQHENRSLAAAEEKANKLKQEFGRRLIDAQKNLSQKDIELESYKNDIDKLHAKYEGQDSWKQKFQELEEKIAPFQEQIDAYEIEKQALLNRNTESQSEIEKLGHQYARLLGHQNQKQKIRHVQKLKDENASLKKEVAKLREETNKEKYARRKLEEKLSKATGTRRFDPSLAFKHNGLENKENTPLKQRPLHENI